MVRRTEMGVFILEPIHTDVEGELLLLSRVVAFVMSHVYECEPFVPCSEGR